MVLSQGTPVQIRLGLKAIPQFRVAEYRIDLVVEGIKARLAVECDGDQWHGPEEYERDQWRQRVLERAGWRFWRIRGSTFYRDPEQAMEPLWQILEEMSIYSKEKGVITADLPLVKIDEVKSSDESQVEKDFAEDRLSVALEYAQKRQESSQDSKYKEMQEVIVTLLQESSQGKDLIADKVLRKLGYVCRGRNRNSLRKKVSRLITDMKRTGLVEEYETDKRIRIRFLNNKEPTLF